MRNRRKTWLVALLIASVLSPLIFISSALQPWRGDNWFTSIIQEAVYPIEYAWFAVSTTVGDGWNGYISLSQASRENEKLKRQLAEQQSRTMDFDEQALEIARLRKLMGFAQHFERRLLVAEIIGSVRTSPFYSLRLSRGSNSGVKVGMPVVTPDGVVGKVIRSGSSFSDVQLLTDTNFHMDVLLQRTRVRGVLRGLSGSRCVLNLHQKAEVRIGDTLITSGIVGGFPKGMPIGQVVKISYESDNVSQVITVEPWVDYRRVEEVFVVESEDQELAKVVETAGFEWLENSLRGNEGGG